MSTNGHRPSPTVLYPFSSRLHSCCWHTVCVTICFLGGCSWSQVEAQTPLETCLGKSGQAFQQPEVWTSSRTASPHSFGMLEKTLPVQFRKCIQIEPSSDHTNHSTLPEVIKHRTYRKKLTGPTIRVRAGDRVRILLENSLEKPTDIKNTPVGDITNLHTHGLHISPTGNSDNVLLSIEPENNFQFQFDIPADHPAGTFWYHPHRHGSTELQVEGGMAGAFIIEGDIDEVPAIKAAKDQLFLVQQLPFGAKEEGGKREKVTTVNGLVAPIIHLQPGEVQRWRFIHAGVSGKLRLAIVDEQKKINQKFHVIALDGLTIGEIYEPGKNANDFQRGHSIEMGPGYRVDFLVKLDQPGIYVLKDLPETRETGMFKQAEQEQTLAIIKVEGNPKPMNLPTNEDLKDLAPMVNIDEDEVLNQNFPRQASFTNNDSAPGLDMNGLSFSSQRIDHSLQLGWVETWHLTDSTNFGPHPFHIHVNPFQVIQIGNYRPEFPMWKDTIFVDADSPVIIRARYETFTGKFVLHCHILSHEDAGMMQLVEIIP